MKKVKVLVSTSVARIQYDGEGLWIDVDFSQPSLSYRLHAKWLFELLDSITASKRGSLMEHCSECGRIHLTFLTCEGKRKHE